MKFKIFKEEIKERETLFKLEEYNEGIRLVAVFSNGQKIPHGNILIITSEGLHCYSDVKNDIGIPLDEHGRIKVKK